VVAGLQPGGEQAAGFVAVDGAVPGAGHAAVAGVDPQGWTAGADAEFGDPVRRPRPVAAAPFLLHLPFRDGGGLRVDALQPHGVPDPQRAQAVQVGRHAVGPAATRRAS
jgi:hypothetical protein